MPQWTKILRSALVSGTCAGVGSTLALAVAARTEGKGPIQPINATSHWRNGDGAGRHTGIDLVHTGVGFATNGAASVFWAVFFETWLARRRRTGPVPLLVGAAVTSVVAAAVDYGPTPKRFTPGWEFVLSRKGMAVAYAGLALGLAGGALLNGSARRR